MNKIYLILGVVFIFVGLLALVLGLGPYSESVPVSGYMARIIVILWGTLLVLCGKKYYGGGFASISGSIFIGVGILAMGRSIETGFFGNPGEEYGVALVYLLIFIFGFMMLMKGHKSHLDNKSN